MPRTVTMKDVASEARVGLRTVSRYVNGETNIDSALAERIGLAITKLGYRRNLAAASIRLDNRSRMLGLIISDMANPFYSTLSRAIENVARERGYLLISASSDEEGERFDQLVSRMMEQQIDGLIVVPPRQPGQEWPTLRPPVPPVVFIDRPVNWPGADVVLADNQGGARAATEALINSGSRRIALIGDNLALYTMSERLAGYRAALIAASIPFDDDLVISVAHDSDEAHESVRSLLSSTDVDGIFAANNRAAVGALRAFRSHGSRIPLIGFDDFEAAQLTEPQVSVVSQDITEMGRLAGELLIGKLSTEQPTAEPRVHTLPTSLILRGSEQPSHGSALAVSCET